MAIGERIKNARIKKGLTQEELARLLGYKSKSSVAHIENGRDIPRAMVVKLAQVLDTTPAYLMGWDDDSIESGTIEGGQNLPSQCMEQDPDIRRIERAKKRMDSETQKRMMTVITSAFSELFNDDYNEDDVDE